MPHPEGYLLRAYKNMPKKARSGIYHGKHVNVANRVSSEYEVRSRRLVKPNVHRVYLYSQALGEKIKLPVTTTALKAIDKAGGLDRYLLKTPDSLLYSDVASNLKFRLTSIYRYKHYEEQQEQKQQQKQQPQHQQQTQKQRPQLASSRGQQAPQQQQLAAAQAAQRAALAAGGTSLPGLRSFSSWSSSRSGSLLPPAAAAAVAEAAVAVAVAAAERVTHS